MKQVLGSGFWEKLNEGYDGEYLNRELKTFKS